MRFIANYKFTSENLDELKVLYPQWEPAFYDYLSGLDSSTLKVYAIKEGTVVFPRVPLLRIEGPLGLCQLLETTLLVLVNYASLVCTNAVRHRLAVGWGKSLLEFGLRRAQGPDGAMSASKYSYIGGFDGSSNVQAGVKWGILTQGTHAHSFVSSFVGMEDLHTSKLIDSSGNCREFAQVALEYRNKLALNSNIGELAAFISYAFAYPRGLLVLVDTYDTLNSGVPNFLAVALALRDFGYTAVGIRLDSGDLAYLSKAARKLFHHIQANFNLDVSKFKIIASNDLNEAVLYSLKEQGHEIDGFGVGTNLVTCQNQPALGGVFKLVEVHDQPRIKVSQDAAKVTIPGRKEGYRLYDSSGLPVLDLLIMVLLFKVCSCILGGIYCSYRREKNLVSPRV